MKDFVNPKSMLTPGVAGALVMFLVNGIASQFPEVPVRYLALFLSFLVGTVVWFAEMEGKAPVLQKAAYWVLNSLVIFVVGFGTANLAADANTGKAGAAQVQPRSIFSVSRAFAQSAPPKQAGVVSTTVCISSPPQTKQALKEKLTAEQEENERLREQLRALQRAKAKSIAPAKDEPRFFKRW